jgi:hypothetical protein
MKTVPSAERSPPRRRTPTSKEHAVTQHRSEEHLSEPERKEIFLALVDAQDGGMSFEQSWKFVTERFNITKDQLKRIEREGIDQQWPPLG